MRQTRIAADRVTQSKQHSAQPGSSIGQRVFSPPGAKMPLCICKQHCTFVTFWFLQSEPSLDIYSYSPFNKIKIQTARYRT